jgi:hypothetical protein
MSFESEERDRVRLRQTLENISKHYSTKKKEEETTPIIFSRRSTLELLIIKEIITTKKPRAKVEKKTRGNTRF